MTHIEASSDILKTDQRGRVRTSPERRRQLLEEFDRSGLSAPKFAALTGLKYQTLAGWLHRRKQEQAQDASGISTPAKQAPVQWFETVVEAGARAVPSPLVLRLPSGAALEVANTAQATLAGTVLRAWERAVRLGQEFAPMQPSMARLPMKAAAAHLTLTCTSCHGSHDFDTQKAAVEACLDCHNDSHSLGFKDSSHYEFWRKELNGGTSGTGVSCATCHLPRESHQDGDMHRVLVQHNQNANLRPNEKGRADQRQGRRTFLWQAFRGIASAKHSPLFRSASGRTARLTNSRMSRTDVLKMIKRRARKAGLPPSICCHTFRGTGIATFLENGGTIESAQAIAGHESPRTTKLYDRTSDELTLDEIKRIRI